MLLDKKGYPTYEKVNCTDVPVDDENVTLCFKITYPKDDHTDHLLLKVEYEDDPDFFVGELKEEKRIEVEFEWPAVDIGVSESKVRLKYLYHFWLNCNFIRCLFIKLCITFFVFQVHFSPKSSHIGACADFYVFLTKTGDGNGTSICIPKVVQNVSEPDVPENPISEQPMSARSWHEGAQDFQFDPNGYR